MLERAICIYTCVGVACVGVKCQLVSGQWFGGQLGKQVGGGPLVPPNRELVAGLETMVWLPAHDSDGRSSYWRLSFLQHPDHLA